MLRQRMFDMSGLRWFGRSLRLEMQHASPCQTWPVCALGGLNDKHLATSCQGAFSLLTASVHLSTPTPPVSSSEILLQSNPRFIQGVNICERKTSHCRQLKMSGIKATIFLLIYLWMYSSSQGRAAGEGMGPSVSVLSP